MRSFFFHLLATVCTALSVTTNYAQCTAPVITASGPTTFGGGGSVTLSGPGDSWTQKSNFGGTARQRAVSFSIGTKGYVGTGYSGGVNKKDFWEYNPITNAWTQKADFGGTTRSDAVGFSIGTKGYIGTGDDGSFRNDFWEYDPSANTWTVKTPFPGAARASAVGFSIGARGYIGTGVGTGSTGSVKYNDFWEYNPTANTWTSKAAFGGTARSGAVGFSIGSNGYLGMGGDINGSTKNFWVYNQTSNAWIQRADFGGTQRAGAIGFNIGSKGYVGGGFSGGYLNEMWEYDPTTNAWNQKASVGNEGMFTSIGFSIGSKGYMGTGLSGASVFSNKFWEYTPTPVYSWSPGGQTTASIVVNASGDYQLTTTDVSGCTATSSATTVTVRISTVTATAGTPQTIAPNATSTQRLQATVKDSMNVLLAGAKVIFTAPNSWASGTFAGYSLTDTAVTDANGVATADAFTASAFTGSYTVTASVAGITNVANFSLTNACPTTYLVTSNADSGPGTLREALSLACSNVTVSFSPAISQIVLTSGELYINKGVSIVGPGADRLTISGNNASKVFNIDAGSGVVTISGVTVRDGNALANATTYGAGGAIFFNSGTLNLNNCYFTNNTSLNTYEGGGAIDINGGTVNINRCTLANNTGVNGGAINNNLGSLTITNSTIAGNTAAQGGSGGGICSQQYSTATTVTNSTIYGNSATKGGNIAELGGSTFTIGNTIVAGGSVVNNSYYYADIYTSYRITSANYNLVQNVYSVYFAGNTANNIYYGGAGLLPLGLYNGYAIPIMPLLPSSPAINVGNPALTANESDYDQRQKSRRIGGASDIGAIEANYTVTVRSGTNQSAGGLSSFANPLRAYVQETTGAIAGVTVVFTAPSTGASGTFPGGVLVATAVTDVNGIATAPTFNSNNTMGSYNVTASIGTAFNTVDFRLNNTSVLPAIFSNVTAQVLDCAVQLQWTTLSETNAKDYTVEYSTDGNVYNSIATLPAKGNSSTAQLYSYSHTGAATGTGYYRIRQTDRDGTNTYTKIMAVQNNCGKYVVVVKPNPVKEQLTIQVAGTAKQTLTIYDAIGRKMVQQTVSNGTQQINVQSWAKGVYTLVVIQDGKITSSTKVVKD